MLPGCGRQATQGGGTRGRRHAVEEQEKDERAVLLPGELPVLERVVGGTISQYGDWPWLIALTQRGYRDPFCGATLIADQWAITASHCVTKG